MQSKMDEIKHCEGFDCQKTFEVEYNCVTYENNSSGMCQYPCILDQNCIKNVIEGWIVSCQTLLKENKYPNFNFRNVQNGFALTLLS